MNPELQRNAWLELSPHRLIAMPAILLMGAAALSSIPNLPSPGAVRVAAQVVFFAITLFWGARLASDAINDEVRGKTWDLQRMSAISPWSMTWGKLFGATVFAWYGGLIAIAIYLFVSDFKAPWTAPKTALAMIAFGVLSHAFAIAATLQVAQKGWGSGNRWVSLLQVFFLFICALSFFNIQTNHPVVSWYGAQFESFNFILATVCVFAGLAVFAAYRQMCQELQVPTRPWAWVVFTLFLTIFIGGFAEEQTGADAGDAGYMLIVGLLVSITLTYVMLFAENNSPMTLRRLLLRLGARQWCRAFEEIPCWSTTLVMACLFAVGTAVCYAFMETPSTLTKWAVSMPPVFALLLVRDAAIVLFFSFAKQARRADAAAILYITLLYWVFPGLLRALGLPALADFVLPVFDSAGAILIAFLQAALVVTFCVLRWRRNFG